VPRLRRPRHTQYTTQSHGYSGRSSSHDSRYLRYRLLIASTLLHEHLWLPHHPRSCRLQLLPGFKVANPEMTVWQISGDGDGLAIGGNHFIHAVRRNIDINILLFNNKIYGLTKGQYSPTSARGFVSKSSPYGTTEDPFIPAELVFGARGNFFARSIDVELQTSQEVMVAAAKHKGASVVEVLQNCVIFNNGIHNPITDKACSCRQDYNTFATAKRCYFGKEYEQRFRITRWIPSQKL